MTKLCKSEYLEHPILKKRGGEDNEIFQALLRTRFQNSERGYDEYIM